MTHIPTIHRSFGTIRPIYLLRLMFVTDAFETPFAAYFDSIFVRGNSCGFPSEDQEG